MKWRLLCMFWMLGGWLSAAPALAEQGPAGTGGAADRQPAEGGPAGGPPAVPTKPAAQQAPPATSSEPELPARGWLETVEVIAARPRRQGRQDVVWPADLQRRSLSDTVEGSLERLAGIDLNRQTFAGNESGRLSIRGFDESRCRVLLNGRPLHGAGVYGGYYVDWHCLSLEDVERIEVIRGMAPAKYGNTLGGVVNVVTHCGSELPETRFRLGGARMEDVDGLALWGASASHSWGHGPLLWSISAEHYDTDGYLRNAFVERDTFGAGLAFKFAPEVQLRFSGRYTKTKAGMIVYNMPDSPYYDRDYPKALESALGGPGLPFRSHGPGLWGSLDWGDGSYWRDERLSLSLALTRNADDFGFDIGPYFIDEDRSEYFMAVTNRHALVMRRDSEPEKNNWGWRADFNNTFEALGRHTLEYGGAGHYLGYGDMDVKSYDRSYYFGPAPPAPPHPNLQDSEGPGRVSEHNSVYVQDRWEVTKWLELFPGIRLDCFTADGQAGADNIRQRRWGPRLAATLRPWEGGHVTGRYGRAYRFPTLPEYYWYYAGFQPLDRSSLMAESADQWELELGHDAKQRLSLSARGYCYDVDDYLRTIFGYWPSRVVYNIDNVRLWGVELEAKYKLPHGFFVWGNYTWQRTRKAGDVLDSSARLSRELVELPEHKLNVGVGYEKPKGLRAMLALRYVGDRSAIRGDLATPGGAYLRSMDRFFDLDFSASYPIYAGKNGGQVRLEATVDNIVGQHYEEEYGYPMPGPTLRVGLAGDF